MRPLTGDRGCWGRQSAKKKMELANTVAQGEISERRTASSSAASDMRNSQISTSAKHAVEELL